MSENISNKYSNGTFYFENRSCDYYPCHSGSDHINCMFCYCPFYRREECPGNPEFIKKGKKTIKSCMNCRFPHEYGNIDRIMEKLKEDF